MYRKANILFLKAETPMHVGSGDSLGIVDMPIQREKHTGFPKIEASSLKGSMREHFERIKGEKDKEVLAAFGDDGGENSDNSKAGALGFTDARLLLFPVKSMKGVFAWITCPAIIEKFKQELKLAGFSKSFTLKENTVTTKSSLLLDGKHIVLEEYTFAVNKDNNLDVFTEWLAQNLIVSGYSLEKIKKDIVVLSDDDFKDFVNLSTEVITRTKIDNETGTVADGALFTEEYLPAETIMYSLVLTAPEFAKEKKVFNTDDKLKAFFKGFISKHNVLQIGGNATLGKGITKAVFVEPNNGGN